MLSPMKTIAWPSWKRNSFIGQPLSRVRRSAVSLERLEAIAAARLGASITDHPDLIRLLDVAVAEQPEPFPGRDGASAVATLNRLLDLRRSGVIVALRRLLWLFHAVASSPAWSRPSSLACWILK